MENKKGFIITILVLVFIICGLVGYIFYDVSRQKKLQEEKETIINNVNIDLNAFYQITNTLNAFDKAFHNPKSSYVGYIYVSKKMRASKFDLGAAVYASMITEMDATNGTIQYVPETRVKYNFKNIFGENLSYKESVVDSGEVYKVAYNANVEPVRYDYICPGDFDAYSEKYIAVNTKTSLTLDSVLIERKVFFVQYVPNDEGKLVKAVIYQKHDKQTKVGEVALKNGEISPSEVIAKYSSRLLKYQYVFKQEKKDRYTFYSIEPIK
ncbi:MAG: hypothetical protein IJI60_01830 [Bacilli bacterium]|nr:hypothetical protein [Bacilli bacterium]